MTIFRRPLVAVSTAVLCAVALLAGTAGIGRAQSWQTAAQQQARADQVQSQARASALREQQRQRTVDTLRRAFPSRQARANLDAASRAQRERYNEHQDNRIQKYLHREQAAATAAQSAVRARPAPATSSGH